MPHLAMSGRRIVRQQRLDDRAMLGERFADALEVAASRLATTLPRLGRYTTSPVMASCLRASRTGVRDTAKRLASAVSSSRAPGANWPSAIASARCAQT
jgi:hypothetical protein